MLLLMMLRRRRVVGDLIEWRLRDGVELLKRRRVGGGRIEKHERSESVFEKSAEIWVTREDDVSNVLDKLRDRD